MVYHTQIDVQTPTLFSRTIKCKCLEVAGTARIVPDTFFRPFRPVSKLIKSDLLRPSPCRIKQNLPRAFNFNNGLWHDDIFTFGLCKERGGTLPGEDNKKTLMWLKPYRYSDLCTILFIGWQFAGRACYGVP